jgi:hypothetical protein
MTDDQPNQFTLPADIHIGTDACGDPFLIINITTPPGTYMAADMADQLALKILAASASARARSGIIRDQMLTGASVADAVQFAEDVLGDH